MQVFAITSRPDLLLSLNIRKAGVKRISILTMVWILAAFAAKSQCLFYNSQGTATATPVWVSCSGGSYTVYLQSPNSLGSITIDWGDGSGTTTVASLIPPAFVSHTYAAAIANYTVSISGSCTVTGLVVMEEPVNASIQIPIGGVTQTCAPDDVIFQNSSTNVSQNTTFVWNYGDGSPTETYGDTNAGQIVTHTYLPGTVNCVTQVTLSAQNYCSFGNPTAASFNPVQIYDLDDAAITASNVLLCYPDTVVHFANTTAKNCVPQGNTAQRFEYWNFGDYWGVGSDSIFDWTPFDPPAKPGYDIAYPGLGTYTVMMADSNMCGKDTAFITIQIVDAPVAGISSSTDSVCTGSPIVFTRNNVGGNQHLINYGDGSGYVAFGTTNSHSYTTAGTYTVTAVANITGGSASCTDTAMLVIEVLPSPMPLASISPNAGCDSTTAVFINSSSGGATYFWQFGGGQTSTLQNPPPLTYNTPGQYIITLTVTSNNGCTASTNATVNVYDTPAAAMSLANVCEDAVASFSDSSSVGYGGPVNSWHWSFGDPSNSTSTAQNPTFTYVDSGTYVIRFIASTSYCTDTIFDTVLVEPRPVAGFLESDSSGCSPVAVSFTNQSIGSSTYVWSFGGGNTSTQVNPTYTFIHNALSDTTYVVKLVATSAFGCQDSTTDTILVRGNPIALFNSDATLDCAPLLVQFSDSSNGAVSWVWDFNDSTGSTLQNPTHTFNNQTLFISNYTVSLIVTAPNGCTDTATDIVTVYPEPLFSFSIVPDSGCSPLTVNFPVAVGAVVYNWDFGDGNTSTGPNPTHIFYNSTTNNQVFNIQLIAITPFGCVDTVTGSATVFPKPTASLTPAITQGCEPLVATFVNGSTGGTTYAWNFGDGNMSTTTTTTVNHTYPNSTNDTLFFYPTLIASTPEGCADTAQVEVRSFRYVEADFTVPTPGCHPFQATFSNTSTNASTFAWTFGDGNSSTSANPVHLYQNNGSSPVTYSAQLIVQSVEGCQKTASSNVVVNHKPNAQIAPVNLVGCQPLVVNFANNSTGGSSYLWDFNDGDSSNASGAVAHTYPNASNATITRNPYLIVSTNQGCTDTAYAQVQIYRKVEALFQVQDEACHPFTAVFTDQSTNAVSWDWDFDDGFSAVASSPQHVFVNTGTSPTTFNVELTVTSVDNCSDQFNVPVTINPKPNSSFQIANSPACSAEPVVISNQSTMNDTNIWRFGSSGFPYVYNGGQIDTIFYNQTSVTRNFPVELVVQNSYGCADTSEQTMTVYPRLDAQFTAPIEGCSPYEVPFTNLSYGGQLFEWNFGDGQTSYMNDPLHIFENTDTVDTVFTVILKITSPYGCENTDSLDILVHPTPTPIFTANPVVQRYPDTLVTIQNLTSAGPWNWEWNFGDGSVDSTASPLIHSYSAWGTFTILLKSYTAFCEDTVSRNITIEPPLPIANFELELDECAPVTVEFENLSQYGVSFVWDFGDGASSTSENPIHTYQFAGYYTVKLTVIGPGGESDVKEITNAVTVRAQPIANFVFAPEQVNIPIEAVTFINYSQFADKYEWHFGDTTTSAEDNPQKQYTRGGQYFPMLIAMTNFGCVDTFISVIPVTALEQGKLEVPNAFVPSRTGGNGGVYDKFSYDNAVFFPVLTGVVSDEYTFSVFNRWGELLFETHDPLIGWDGWYRGKPCQQDVYVWKVQGKYVTGDKFNKVGDVTLIN